MTQTFKRNTVSLSRNLYSILTCLLTYGKYTTQTSKNQVFIFASGYKVDLSIVLLYTTTVYQTYLRVIKLVLHVIHSPFILFQSVDRVKH